MAPSRYIGSPPHVLIITSKWAKRGDPISPVWASFEGWCPYGRIEGWRPAPLSVWWSPPKFSSEIAPTNINRIYGQRRLAAPHFTFAAPRPDSREILGKSPSTDHRYQFNIYCKLVAEILIKLLIIIYSKLINFGFLKLNHNARVFSFVKLWADKRTTWFNFKKESWKSGE